MIGYLFAGLTAGLTASPHCALMCGPIAALACHRGKRASMGYFFGRTIGYSILGILSGAVGGAAVAGGEQVFDLPSWSGHALSTVLAASLLWAAYRLWAPVPNKPSTNLVTLGTSRRRHAVRGRLWRRLAAPVQRWSVAIGFSTALLPCGALAAAVAMSFASTNPWHGAWVMLGFSVGTGLGLFGVGILSRLFAQTPIPRLRRAFAMLLAVGGVMLLVQPLRGVLRDKSAEVQSHH